MNQGGVKHATEPTRLDNKRERRRGAAGRAAALRRAPSDSDCSGETASLSADSGDRALRPPPPPPRTAKSRSRRRGSEWEVLEGLKDGQRFEKRPDVFNGYLHKKRKWPLKGWHKRFFVVDGGILVYARSPTDVARGRLHGSVDVGLSVISAKARRRRIDIDADEFIYHLRAKTADVFRTWLSVLKAHRLYRQHLLTFGAREAAPKAHAPLDDLPVTDTSSRASSIDFSTSSSTEDIESTQLAHLSGSAYACDTDFSAYNNTADVTVNDCHGNSTDRSVLPSDDGKINYDSSIRKHKSLCSMNCVAMRFVKKITRNRSVNISQGSTEAEKQMISADLDRISSLSRDRNVDTSLNSNVPLSATTKDFSIRHAFERKPSLFHSRKVEPTTAYYFFTKKKTSESVVSVMRKSKKSTNLVKYKNVAEEPPLRQPLNKCILLGKYKIKIPKRVETIKSQHRATVCDEIPKQDDEVLMMEHKSLQDVMTTSEYDKITEKLMLAVFENFTDRERGDEVKYCINQIIKDLYDVHITRDMNPVKALFRGLLEYWLKNTSVSYFRNAMRNAKSVNVQSHEYFTKDVSLSNYFIGHVNKGTQFHGLSEPVMRYYKKVPNSKNQTKTVTKVTKVERKHPPKCNSPKRDTESFERERRIQELEKLLKNTVYVCETSRKQSKEKDIEITKTLINNIGRLTRRSDVKASENPEANSNSSTELPEIQDTINHLISETFIPPDVAKEFLSAYLDVLLHDNSKSSLSSQSSENSVEEQDDDTQANPAFTCEVNAESVVKRVSKSVTTLKDTNLIDTNKKLDDKSTNIDMNQPVDPGQLYLKDILDKITTIFSKVTKFDDKNWQNVSNEKPETVNDIKDELGRPVKEYTEKSLIHENCDENAVVIDLSKYDLENISMFSDPAIKGIMSLTIKLKEKSQNFGESKKHLSLKISEDTKPKKSGIKSDHWISYVNPDDAPNNVFKNRPIPNTFMDLDCVNTDSIGIKSFMSSDANDNSFRVHHESEHSMEICLKNNKSAHRQAFDTNDDTQSCYVMSLKKGTLSKFQSKNKVSLKDCKRIVVSPKINDDEPAEPKDESTVFDRPAPKVIDEKFILLLLENLSLLSKNLPSLHKDISNLYIKLKKKHEKVIRNCSTIQGLSLLGKIYNEESCNKTTGDNGTQFESVETTFKTVQTLKEVKHTSANTSKCYLTETPIDKALNTDASELINTGIQTEKTIFKIVPRVLLSKNEPMDQKTSTNHSNIHAIREQATSNSNWFTDLTQECAVSKIIKSVMQSGSTHDFRIPRPDLKRDGDHKKKRQSPEIRQNLINEITLLSPSFKVSTQSQTQKVRLVRDTRRFEKDFKVYHLYVNAMYEPTKSSSVTVFNVGPKVSAEVKTLYRCTSDPSYSSGLISPTSPPLRGPQAGFVSGTPGGRLASWILESGGPLESVSRELGQAQLSVQQLQRLLDALELHHQVHHDTDVSLEGASPSVKKDRRKFGLRKKKSNSKCASVELQPPHIDPSSSHMALSALTAPPSPGGGSASVPNSAASLPIACAAARPQSLPAAEALAATGPASITSLTPDHQLREDFTVLAKDLVTSLKSVLATMVCERGRLRAAMESADSATSPAGAVMVALRTNLSSALQQNSELRSRLSRIHDASDLAEISVGPNSDAARQFQQSLSYSSSCVSASEFFDAEEHDENGLQTTEIIAADEAGVIELDGDSSSEAGSLSSEEGSANSDGSDNSDVVSGEQVTLRPSGPEPRAGWARRTRLPAPRAQAGGPSLWNLLYKNIGKDLSQISMPVTINEPLNMLQRLCEELEYCELLDSAAACSDAVERLSLVAAFAVSAYASSAHRAASKPFNPLLAETYECVRDDKGFRFLAEQVSHHPPISACHAEAGKWCFWQEARIKTKFWGKSMEFQPAGRVHVRLTTTGDHYSWNKVTTCVHNLFGGQRWVDQYGEMQIVAHGTDMTCKLNFVKASSWSGSRHEVRGGVAGRAGTLRLAGRWSEALYAGDPPRARLLWRPGAMPPEQEIYYGFTRFAMELNELEPGMREALPHTDTRLRPDQRALEEGDVDSAERYKLQLEQAQRERRRDQPLHQPAWFRRALEDGEEMWVFSGEYWKAREAGFGDLSTPRIW